MILCCGEALIDMLPRETAQGEPAFAPHPGGAVFNTAIALGRLGTPAGFFGGLSSDLFGRQLAAALEESRVDIALAPRPDRPTTLAFVTLAGGQASYAFYDENTALRMMRPEHLPDLSTDVEALFFGGISLAAEPCGDTFAALCARAGNRPVMIDPNVRPGFIEDEAAYRARLAPMLARADIVKVSDEDLRWLTGGEDAGALLEAGAGMVLLTRGAAGAEAVTPRGTVSVPARKANVVDTVGAGDTFNAGVLAGLRRGELLSRERLAEVAPEALVPALDLGAQAAAICVARAGANPPWERELT